MFAISANSLPTIRSYEEAVKFWETAKPQGDLYRALNPKNKRDTAKRVWRDGDTIHFRYHHTDVVTYSKDSIGITFWDSVSTVIFANELTPYEFRMYNYRGNMVVNGMMPRQSTLVFNKVDDKYVVDETTVMPQYRFDVDRKIASEVRKRLTPFLKYRAARAALHGDRLATGSARMVAGFREWFHALVNRETEWPELYFRTLHFSSEIMHRELVVLAGGVHKVQLPIGVLPTKSVYDGYIYDLS